eukprot:m.310269 g.310269  ORF g.310269 m.310269 type:complete len:139 (+) comp50550_c0_seq1:20-436(+)
MSSEDADGSDSSDIPRETSPFSFRLGAYIENWKKKILNGFLSAFLDEHPFAGICASVTLALSFLPLFTFLVYTLVTLLLTVLVVLVIEGVLLVFGLFVLLCAVLLSFIVSLGITGFAFLVWTLSRLISLLWAKRSKVE